MSRYANRHEFFASVDEVVQRLLEENGIDAALCEQCGAAVADGIAAEWASQEIYVPQDASYKLSKREAEALRQIREGTPKDQVRRNFNMSRQGFARLLKRAHARDRHLDQGKLFEA
ncbi:Mor transcription activator family protein [Thermomonas sp.]|uniref:Mor transcription activator family protein n=1 Tax=Thermomonas sp. TaxID=1971895 RepID=UPI0035B127C3